MDHAALLHEAKDDVAVVVIDITAGDEVKAVTLAGESIGMVKAVDDIPLGHKIALRDIAMGEEVIKYGRCIGKAVQDIAQGAYLHVHNVKTVRWANVE